MKVGFVIFIGLFIALQLYAENNYLIEGYIFNQETGEVIPGASVQIDGKQYGTYTSASGKFRMPLPEGTHKIKISSMGYKTHYINVSEIDKEMKIFLLPDPVLMQNVEVTGDIDAGNIIKRAIARKSQNVSTLRNFTGELYSKFVIEVSGSALNISSSGNSMTLSTDLGDGEEKKYQMYIMETFSDNYIDYETEQSRSIIKNRRQTANIQPQENLFVLSNFQSFYDDYFKLVETRIMNPLNDNALSRYDYFLTERQKYDDKFIYVINVVPTTKTYPAFQGTIKIVEGTYNMIELELTTSKTTALPFVKNLNISQKFNEIEKNIWHPVYYNITADANLEVVRGLIDLDAEITATSIYNNYSVNNELPDSLFRENIARITVSKGVDKADSTFWERNALRDLSEKERYVYEEIGASKIRDENDDYIVSYGLLYYLTPYLDFNRVTAITPGFELDIPFLDKYKLHTFAGYSFGQNEPIGKAKLNYRLINNNKFALNLYGAAFSEYNTHTSDKSINRYANLILASFYHEDYYDYYKNDGFETGVEFFFKNLNLDLNLRKSNHYSLDKTTNRSIFIKDSWRENPRIIDGTYLTAGIKAKLGNINMFQIGSTFDYELNLNGFFGRNLNEESSFANLEGSLEFLIPTFNTGYSPMMLRTKLLAGKACCSTPIQYQFRMPTRLSIISGFGSMFTAPIGIYGGMEYFSAHMSYNLTDLWWRAMRLPVYQGRGIDLLLAASATQYKSTSNYSYLPTGDDIFAEIGFGFSRIPTFVSNIVFVSADFRWGVGALAKGGFGWSVSLAYPF